MAFPAIFRNIAGIVAKTVVPAAIRNNLKQGSTKAAGVAATVAMVPSLASLQEGGTMVPDSEGAAIFQLVSAIVAVILYYIDTQGKGNGNDTAPKE